MSDNIINLFNTNSAEGVITNTPKTEEYVDNGVEDVINELSYIEIENLLVLTVESDGVLRLRANDLSEMEIVYMLEMAKASLLER